MGKREDTKKPRLSVTKGNNYKHGHRSNIMGKPSTEYMIWSGLKKRCDNPKCNVYSYYGGRGITYDKRWLDFALFLEDVGLRPSKEHSLERLDNNKGYYKENVKWATRAEQSKNRTNNIVVEGLVLKDWCNLKGFHYKTVWRWYCREGKSLTYIVERGSLLWAKERL